MAKILAFSMCVSTFQPGGADGSAVQAAGNVICEWDFEDNTVQGWAVSNWSSTSMNDMQVAASSGKLELTLNYANKDDGGDNSWVKAGIEQLGFDGKNFEGAEEVSFDFYYEKDAKSQGDLTLQVAAQDNAEWEEIIPDDKKIVDITGNGNLPSEEADGGLVKTTVSVALDKTKLTGQVGIGKLVLVVVGKSTDYNGTVYFDNIRVTKADASDTPGGSTGDKGNIIREWDFEDNTVQGWAASDWSSTSMNDMQVTAETGKLGLALNYSGKDDSGETSWVKAGIEQTDFSGVNFEGADGISFDFYYEKDKKTQGDLAIQAAAQDNAEWKEVIPDEKRIIDITGNGDLPFEEADGGFLKTTITVPLDKTKMTEQVGIGKLVLIVVGKNTDYNGKVYFDNIRVTKAPVPDGSTETKDEVIKEWDFENGLQDWKVSSDWGTESITNGLEAIHEAGKLGLALDFSGKTEADGSDSWIKAGIVQETLSGINFEGAEKISFDFYYEKDKKTKGDLAIQASAQDSAEWGEIIPEDSRILDITGNANLPVEEVDGGLVKVTGSIMLDQAKMSSLVGIGKLVLVVVGKSTDYNGKVYFDNIKISKTVSAVTPTTAPVTTRRPYYPVIVPTETPAAVPTETPSSTETPAAASTATPKPTETPVPAETSRPTVSPEQTVTPVPVETGKPGTTTEVTVDDVTGAVKEVVTTVAESVVTVVENVTWKDGTKSRKEAVTETVDGVISVTETFSSSKTGSVLVKKVKRSADGTVLGAEAVVYTGVSELGSGNYDKNLITEDFLLEAKNAGIKEVSICIEKPTVDALKDGKMAIGVEVPGVDGISVGNIMISKDGIMSAAESKQKLVVKIASTDAKAFYTVAIPQSELKKIKGSFDITVQTGDVSSMGKKEQKNVNGILSANKIGKKDAAVVAIAANDPKGSLTVTAPASALAKAGSNAYVYCYNRKTGKLEEIANSKCKVQEDKTVSFEGSSGKDYIVVNKELKGKSVVTLLGKTKVSVGKSSVKKGKKTKIKIQLPSELVMKTSLKKDVPYAKQAVVVTYKSSNKKAAKVSKNGTITALGKGKATITVKIKLAGGKVKTVKKKIKIK